ncbi:MAG: hypothetical protein QM642_07915 [Edaphocola sp.]
MKKARLILSASMLAAAGFTAATFTSCTKEETCNVGYEGDDCKTLSRDKFIGQWKGTEECTLGTDDYSITITASSTSEVGVVLNNIYNQSFVGTGTMTGTNGFSFSGQGTGSGGGTVTFSGTATLNSTTGQLSVVYEITSTAATNSCEFTGTKL